MNCKLIITSIAVLALAAPAFAAEKETTKAAKKSAAEKAAVAETSAETKTTAAAGKPLPYQGKVAAIDTSAKTFTTKNKDGKEHLFAITADTKIEKADGSEATLNDIKVDEVVRGTRRKTGENRWDAVKVIIGAKAGKAAATASGEKP